MKKIFFGQDVLFAFLFFDRAYIRRCLFFWLVDSFFFFSSSFCLFFVLLHVTWERNVSTVRGLRK